MGSYRRALARALLHLGERLEDLVVLDADTARSTGTIAFAERFRERFFNVGISEQDLVGRAAGLAIAGLRPVAAAFASFMMRAWEQVRNTVDRDSLNVKLVATHAGLSAHVDGSSHQALEDVALMRSLARTAVVVPADEAATFESVVWLVERLRGPAYVRLERDNAPSVYEECCFKFRLGGLEVLEDGGDAAILAFGPMVGVALEASRILRRRGLRVGVVDVYSVKPLGRLALERIARSQPALVTLEDHRVNGGLGGAVAEALSGLRGAPPLLRLGVPPGVYGSSARSFPELLSYMRLDPASVARRVEVWLRGEA
jgi:transketolase